MTEANNGRPRGRGRAVLVLGSAGAAAALVATAGPAVAAVSGQITAPSDKQTFTDGSTSLTPSASVTTQPGDDSTATLRISDPYATANAGCSWTYASQGNAGLTLGASYTLSGTPIKLAQAYPSSCATQKGTPAANGTWKLLLTYSRGQQSSTFVVKVPPTAPSGVTATPAGPLQVTVAWHANPELDTHAYAVVDPSGRILGGPWNAADACSAAGCTETVAAPAPGDQQFAVRAYRYAAPPTTDGNAADLTTDSTPATASVAPATATAASSGAPAAGATVPATSAPSTAGRGSSEHRTGSTGRSSSAPQRSAGARGVGAATLGHRVTGSTASRLPGAFTPLTAPTLEALPPLPQVAASPAVSPPASVDGEPTDPGTYKKSLGYSPETRTVVTHTASSTPLAGVADAIGISADALWRSLAGSLVLLLAAAHVRRWSHPPTD